MRMAGLGTYGKWEPCVNSLAADQVADPPFFANWDGSLPPHPFTHRHTNSAATKLLLKHAFERISI